MKNDINLLFIRKPKTYTNKNILSFKFCNQKLKTETWIIPEKVKERINNELKKYLLNKEIAPTADNHISP
jgi:hypothetical protein